ncbi:hypothetical protein JW824_13135 [bacterium]|nr:hypothetical protein [bacterium]RQV93785.1 MAG: hypothetical protein EH221_08925 [bacterium]
MKNFKEGNELVLFGKTITRKRLILICWIVAIILGAFQAWDTRHYVNPDGLSYLDMGDAYLRGDWDMAINAYWSPFYSWLTGLTLSIIKPSPYWEASVIHLLNFLIFLGSMACFHFFLNQLIKYNQFQIERNKKTKYQSFPEWAWIILGYSLFIWTSLDLITLTKVTPDICLTGFVYLSCGLLIRMRMGFSSVFICILFGIVLGFGYLVKVPSLPIAFFFLGSSIFMIGHFRNNWTRVLISSLSFAIVCGSFAIMLSKEQGRFTFGDSGKLNYAWYVNGVSMWVHWQGDELKSGTPMHPTRKISDKPVIYEFEIPIQCTYPPWYDPAYWHEGLTIYFNIKQQIAVLQYIIENFYVNLFFQLQAPLVVGFLIFFLTGWNRPDNHKILLKQWPLLIPAIIAMSMFALVHVETRFLGAYIVLLWLGLFSGIHLFQSSKSIKWAKNIILAVVITLMTITVIPFGMRTYHLFADLIGGKSVWVHKHFQVAQGIKQLNIHDGDKVGFIGHAIDAYWARLASIQIIAEIPYNNIDSFWAADSAVKKKAFQIFSDIHAKAVLTSEVPQYALLSEWQRLGDTGYFFYDLRKKSIGEEKNSETVIIE